MEGGGDRRREKVKKVLFLVGCLISLNAFPDEMVFDHSKGGVVGITFQYERSCLEKRDLRVNGNGALGSVVIPFYQSCIISGIDIFYGNGGIKRNAEKGFNLIKMGCDSAESSSAAHACGLVARVFYCGHDEIHGMWGEQMGGGIASKYNKEQALKYFAKACDLGDSEGCNFKIAAMNNASCYRN